jgi:hypothetical protein
MSGHAAATSTTLRRRRFRRKWSIGRDFDLNQLSRHELEPEDVKERRTWIKRRSLEPVVTGGRCRYKLVTTLSNAENEGNWVLVACQKLFNV